MNLFQAGTFQLHSGEVSGFKIDCDALCAEDWAAIAQQIVRRVGPFGAVEGVPGGGLALAEALWPYVTAGSLLIVDDVLSTGASMEEHRRGRCNVIGAVLFARTTTIPDWITALFTMAEDA